jgi:Concanavalin A-like lectin/glucanases superfamily
MKLGLGLSLANRGGAGGISSPIPLSGLSLWVKANAGVTTAQRTLLTDLAAYWKLDDTNWTDSSGNGRTLSNNNGVTNTSGIINYGASFNGSTQFLLTSSFPFISGDFSVSFWVNVTDTQTQQTFIESPTYGALNIYFLYGSLCVNDYMTVSEINEVGSFNNNTWYNIVVIKNNGITSAYSNGEFLASTEQNMYIDSSIGIGASSYLSDFFTNGKIDEVGVWSRALSQDEITYLYNTGNGHSYPFSSSPTIEFVSAWADQSGNGNNATAIDTPTLSTVSGKTFVDFAGGYFTGNELITSPYATIMCVARFSSTRDIEAMFQQFSGYDNLLFYRGFDLNSGFRIYNGRDLSSSSLTSNNQTYLFGVTVNNDEAGTLYLNSAVDGNDYCGEQAPAGNYYLGRWVGDERTTTELQMAEIVVYDRVLTTPERQQVEAYLMEKYAICQDTTSSVLMTGWVAGPRTLTPIGYAPYGNETYTYGDEVVRYETGVWIYANSGLGEIARAYSTASRPWLATWPAGFTAQKICS